MLLEGSEQQPRLRKVIAFGNVIGIIVQRQTQTVPAMLYRSDNAIARIDEVPGPSMHKGERGIAQDVPLIGADAKTMLRQEVVGQRELGKRPIPFHERSPCVVAHGAAARGAPPAFFKTGPFAPERIVFTRQNARMPWE